MEEATLYQLIRNCQEQIEFREEKRVEYKHDYGQVVAIDIQIKNFEFMIDRLIYEIKLLGK